MGAALATVLDPSLVKWVFAAFCLMSACRLIFMTPPKELSGESVERAELEFVGPMPQVAKPNNGVPSLFFGTICGMIGVGGANLFVPFLMTRKLCLRQTMATASALQIPISVAGALAYVVLGWTNATPGSLGFIYVPALLVTGLISFIAAPFGARLSRAVSVVTLRKIFGAVTVGIGLKMAGAFNLVAGVLSGVPH